MPLTIPTPSATIASAVAERLGRLVYAREDNVIFRDTPRRGEPGIYEARNGELALATQGMTQAQRFFLEDIFQGEFRRYGGQDALYFTSQSPKLHIPGHLTPSITLEQTAAPGPSLGDIPRLTKLAELVPLLSQGHPFATVESSILHAMNGWCKPGFDWIAWGKSDEAIGLRNFDLLDQATPAQLEKLLTALRRAERFVEGAIETAYRSKLLMRIAQRAATILQQAEQIHS